MKHTNLLTQEDLARFDRIDRDCLEMHVCPPPKTFIELSVTDGDGIEVERYTDRAHSWVRNFYNTMLCEIGDGNLNNSGEINVAGSTYRKYRVGTAASSSTINMNTGANGVDYEGILVGSGNGAESFNSYELTTPILTGSTSGKLTYNAESTPVYAYNASTKKWTITRSRVYNNNSGASITVNEVAICAGSNASTSMLHCRDLLASAVTVPNAGQLTVTYTIEMTFPA